MLENPPKVATFDHVDTNGDLIFLLDNTPLRIHVNDTLERAIATSKRTTRYDDETGEQENPAQQTSKLPISQIQALIRAGMTPEQVAQRYHVSETQVRRFSASVETEKQYAIEQFLLVPAPKQSNMRTLADLIERTLAKAHIGMETIKWHATRRGLEPWRISAEFKTATRTIKAGWTWNMHDNTVTCVNPSAHLLLGEQQLNASQHANAERSAFAGSYRDTIALNMPFAHDELPGNSIRSARIEREVSQWDTTDETETAHEKRNTADTAILVAQTPRDPENPSAARKQKTLAISEQKQETTTASPTITAETQPPTQDSQPTQNEQLDHTDQTSEAKPEVQSRDHHKRHNGRSAIPSWDEILFGES